MAFHMPRQADVLDSFDRSRYIRLSSQLVLRKRLPFTGVYCHVFSGNVSMMPEMGGLGGKGHLWKSCWEGGGVGGQMS